MSPPDPLQGEMFVVCARCSAQLPSVPVALCDEANGATSHGLCYVCEREELIAVEAYFSAMRENEYHPECDQRDQT